MSPLVITIKRLNSGRSKQVGQFEYTLKPQKVQIFELGTVEIHVESNYVEHYRYIGESCYGDEAEPLVKFRGKQTVGGEFHVNTRVRRIF